MFCLSSSQADPAVDPHVTRDSAVQQVLSLSWLLDRSLTDDQVRQALGADKTDVWLSEIVAAGAKLKIPLQRQTLTLDALRQRGGAALLSLHGPNQIVALAAIGAQDSLLYDAGRPEIVSNTVLMQRYSGEALVLGDSKIAEPRLQVENPVRIVEVRDDEPEQIEKVVITNRGRDPLEVTIQSISCGCTSGHYSPQPLSAGQSDVLNLSVNAHGDRIVLVTLSSNDPLWPRVLMALQVKKK